MKKSLFTTILCICVIGICMAQKPHNQRINIQTTLDSLIYDLANYQQKEIKRLQSDSVQQSQKIDSLNNIISKQEKNIQNNTTKINKQNEEIASQKKTIDSKDKEIKELKKQVKALGDAADTMHQINITNCLYLKYSPEIVDYGLSEFNKISNEKIKEKYNDVYLILKDYKKYNDKLISILSEAQNDSGRNPKGDSDAAKQFADKYTAKIKEMAYYKEWYSKKYTIHYINNKIDQALKMLVMHAKMKQADFSGIIDELK